MCGEGVAGEGGGAVWGMLRHVGFVGEKICTFGVVK